MTIKRFLDCIFSVPMKEPCVRSEVVDGTRNFYAKDGRWIGQMNEVAFQKVTAKKKTTEARRL